MEFMQVNISESECFFVPWNWLKDLLERSGEFNSDYDEFMNNHSFEDGKEILQLALALDVALFSGKSGGLYKPERPYGSDLTQLMQGGMDC